MYSYCNTYSSTRHTSSFLLFGPPLSCWCLIVALLFFWPPRAAGPLHPPRPPPPGGAPSSHHLTLLFLGRASLSITTSPVPHHQRAPWPWVPRTSPLVAAYRRAMSARTAVRRWVIVRYNCWPLLLTAGSDLQPTQTSPPSDEKRRDGKVRSCCTWPSSLFFSPSSRKRFHLFVYRVRTVRARARSSVWGGRPSGAGAETAVRSTECGVLSVGDRSSLSSLDLGSPLGSSLHCLQERGPPTATTQARWVYVSPVLRDAALQELHSFAIPLHQTLNANCSGMAAD